MIKKEEEVIIERVQVVSTALHLTQDIIGYDAELDKIILQPKGGVYSTREVQLPSLEVNPRSISSVPLDLDNLSDDLKERMPDVLAWLIEAFEYSYANTDPVEVADPYAQREADNV